MEDLLKNHIHAVLGIAGLISMILTACAIQAGGVLYRRFRRAAIAHQLGKIKMKSFGVVVLLLLSSCLARSAPITGVTQTWTYDPETHSGTVHIVNVSHKNITALSIGLYIAQHDGSTFIAGERNQEFNPTPFAPGETKDITEHVPQVVRTADLTNPNNIQAEVDVVIFADDTAEVTNQRAFDSIIANRKAQLVAMKKVGELVAQLNDPEAITAELNRLSSIAKASGDSITYIEMENAVSKIPKDKQALAAFLTAHEQRATEIAQHANIKVVRP